MAGHVFLLNHKPQPCHALLPQLIKKISLPTHPLVRVILTSSATSSALTSRKGLFIHFSYSLWKLIAACHSLSYGSFVTIIASISGYSPWWPVFNNISSRLMRCRWEPNERSNILIMFQITHFSRIIFLCGNYFICHTRLIAFYVKNILTLMQGL